MSPSSYSTSSFANISWEASVKTLTDLPMTDPIGTARLLESTGEVWIKEDHYWKVFGIAGPDEYLIRTTLFGKDLYGV